MLNKDFDNNLMDEDYYGAELKKLYKDIKSLNKEITNFSSSGFKNFETLTNMQQRALVLSNVDKIGVVFDIEDISIVFRDLSQKKQKNSL